MHAAYTVLASGQVVTFPADATTQRRVFAGAFLDRAEAAVADLEARAAIRSIGGWKFDHGSGVCSGRHPPAQIGELLSMANRYSVGSIPWSRRSTWSTVLTVDR